MIIAVGDAFLCVSRYVSSYSMNDYMISVSECVGVLTIVLHYTSSIHQESPGTAPTSCNKTFRTLALLSCCSHRFLFFYFFILFFIGCRYEDI